jgi:hypothetical protein
VNYFASDAFDEDQLDHELRLELVHLPSINVVFADFEMT